ncbi:MAG: Heteropolysaccharide repeat unit export protein [Candidatus Magasanikbacteria bacterium GW2011_GWC2_34_16]|uniref:Heteropolysaccharide repeat unit export protein n=2 Tax=Candidatus Magasanikiibacteriota TaxID=1752731 RepID=A0A0G0HG26_9BACT|nr:MAG: Heteropolysaccharide repeat unit export protein [Candidatus Magasanikbacteria bacterium GW2011_GWC2_34_16]KKQ41132.1 MAG: Heteropolysaccharide repeat unit export protein [Candidatus Magasanikbacteria bacterium GW2011_GWA2_37_8]
MSLTKTIAHNTSIQLVGKTVSTLLGIIAVMIMTRSLGLEKFGWYAMAVGYLQFVGILSDFGFTVTTANMLAEPQFDKPKLLNVLFTWRFITALIFQGLAPLVFLFFPYPTPVKIAVAITAVSFFVQALNQIFTAYYQVQLKTVITITGEVLGRLALVGGVALIAYYHAGFLPVMITITIAAIISTIYMWSKITGLRFSLDKIISKAIYTKIWPNAVAVIFNSFYLQGDRVILPLFVSATDVGLYSAAYRVLDIVVQMAAMIMGIMMPLITYAWSRNLKTEFKIHYQTALNLTALILLPVLAGMIILANPIMLLVGGADFVSAGKILIVLSSAILGICFGMVFGHTALGIGRQRQALWIYGIDAVLSIIGYFIFIPRYGIYGAGGVTIFSELFAGIMLALLVRHYSATKLKFFTFGKIIFASAIMAGLVYLFQPLSLIWSVLIGAIIYSALVLILKIISWNTIKEIFAKNKLSTAL